jgi:hypothetical protein
MFAYILTMHARRSGGCGSSPRAPDQEAGLRQRLVQLLHGALLAQQASSPSQPGAGKILYYRTLKNQFITILQALLALPLVGKHSRTQCRTRLNKLDSVIECIYKSGASFNTQQRTKKSAT